MPEEWREIEEWPGYYISNHGRARRGNKPKAAFPNRHRNNYVYLSRGRHGKPKALSVHRLVARYFIPNPLNKPQVNHLDNDVTNNHVTNLEWATHQENMAHKHQQGRQGLRRGEVYRSVLTEEQVRQIKRDLRDTKLTMKEVAAKNNTNYSNVASIKLGLRWKHVEI